MKLFIALVFSLTLHAQNITPSNINSWKYHANCQGLRPAIEQIIETGLNRLILIRPDLTKRVKNFSKIKDEFQIKCEATNEKISALYNWNEHSITIGQDIINELRNFNSNSNSILIGDAKEANKYRLHASNVIFHEFLHALELDNLSEDKHNSILNKRARESNKDRMIRVFNEDQIFSCAEIAYPDRNSVSSALNLSNNDKNEINIDEVKSSVTTCCSKKLRKSLQCADRINELYNDYFKNLNQIDDSIHLHF